MINKKLRRHSGWTFPYSTIKAKKKEIINECLEPQAYYDDWNNYRDGFRDFLKDGTKNKKVSLIKMYETYDFPWADKLKKTRHKIMIQKRIRKIRKNQNI